MSDARIGNRRNRGIRASGNGSAAQPTNLSFRDLLEHFATHTPQPEVRIASTDTDLPILAEPTPDQRDAFDLIGAPISLTLK